MVSPSNTVSVPADGSVYLNGILLPRLLNQVAAPVTYCRMLYDDDGQACDFLYLYANPAFVQGMGVAEVVGRRTSEVFPHVDTVKRSVMRAYERVVRTGIPETSEHFSDAIRKWVTLHIVRPQPDHFCVVFTDIRERVPGDRLRSTFEAMAEGFYVRNRDGDVLDNNPAAERILGTDTKTMRTRGRAPLGRGFHLDGSVYSSDEWPSNKTIRTGKPLRDEIMGFEFPDGTLKWLSFNTQPIGPDPDRPDFVVTTFVDITERIKAEQRRLNTLESIGDGYLAIDANWRFRYANAAAERLLGMPRESLLGRVHWDVYPHTLGTAIEVHYRETAAGRPTVFEYENPENKRCLIVRCFPRESGGIEVFFTDETETRRAREALRQSNADLRRLVSQMNTVEAEERLRIAREIHDDLQQSLAAVRLELGTILKLTQGAESEVGDLARVASRHLGEVIESTRRIVRDLRPPELDAIGLNAALEGLLDRSRNLTGLKAKLRPLCAPGPQTAIPPEVAYCLYRIAQEALNNVHKHAGASAVEVSLDCSTEDGVRLMVRDDGRGFRPDDLLRDDSFGVLGMQERVMALGGTLSIEPVAEGGTLVTATIPFSR